MWQAAASRCIGRGGDRAIDVVRDMIACRIVAIGHRGDLGVYRAQLRHGVVAQAFRSLVVDAVGNMDDAVGLVVGEDKILLVGRLNVQIIYLPRSYFYLSHSPLDVK